MKKWCAGSSLLMVIIAILLFPLRAALTQTTAKAGKAKTTKPKTTPPAPAKAKLTDLARYCVLYDFGPDKKPQPVYQNGVGVPYPAVMADDKKGNFWTTTALGGEYGKGTVIAVSPVFGQTTSVKHDFKGYDPKTDDDDGVGPYGGLALSNGNFYGTTFSGGRYGEGTVFRITAGNDFKVIWDFRNGEIIPPLKKGEQPTQRQLLDAAGATPVSAPVAVGGSLFGVATYVGAAPSPYGAIYEIDGDAYQGVYLFDPKQVADNGGYPLSLSAGKNGALWGVTKIGGLGHGTIFRYQAGQSGTFTTVHKFTAQEQGSYGVIEGPGGILYGAAQGVNSYGYIYKFDPTAQKLTSIYNFNGKDGASPVAELTLGQDGKLYGVTAGGGVNGRGVIFSVKLDGTGYIKLFDMDMNDGRYAMSPLLEKSKGNFYGITAQGGLNGTGVFFHLAVNTYPTPANQSYFLAQEGEVRLADGVATVKSDLTAFQADQTGKWVQVDSDPGIVDLHPGILVQLACPRDPHIVQFVYRMAAGAKQGDQFSTTWTTAPFQFTTDPANPMWHTDAIGHPNPYYDQAPGASHNVTTVSAGIFDAPEPFQYVDAAGKKQIVQATWQVTAKDFCICDCKVVRVVNWTRGGQADAKTGKLGASKYTNISVEPQAPDTPTQSWSNQQLQWIDEHLAADVNKYDTILPN